MKGGTIPIRALLVRPREVIRPSGCAAIAERLPRGLLSEEQSRGRTSLT